RSAIQLRMERWPAGLADAVTTERSVNRRFNRAIAQTANTLATSAIRISRFGASHGSFDAVLPKRSAIQINPACTARRCAEECNAYRRNGTFGEIHRA